MDPHARHGSAVPAWVPAQCGALLRTEAARRPQAG
jgi:hypothetical protein